jgi:hypothetical protein
MAKQNIRACEAGDRNSSPRVSFIKINSMRMQKSLELFLERLLSMM